MEIVSITAMVLIIVAFFMGIVIGQKLSRKEDIKLPEVKKENIPFTKEHKTKVEQDKSINKLNQILDNINNYNGTAQGQKEVK